MKVVRERAQASAADAAFELPGDGEMQAGASKEYSRFGPFVPVTQGRLQFGQVGSAP